MAASQPFRSAVVHPQGRDASGRPAYTFYTFRQLDQVSNRTALGLQRFGLRAGDRVALMVPPSLDFFAITFALFKLGAIPVLIDPGIGIKHLGIGLGEAQPSAFIGILKAQTARAVLGWARGLIRHSVTVGGPPVFGGKTLGQVQALAEGSTEFETIRPTPGQTAAILFTSGSTGPSKGVVYTHEFFGGQVDHIRQLYGIQPGETDLPTFPLFALFGPALGMTAILPEMDPTRPAQVDPVKILEAIENFGVTNMFGSPALINRVGRYGAERGLRLPTLRRVISAGAPVPAKVLERFASLLAPGVQVFTPYGATECLPVSSIGSDEVLRETRRMTEQGRGVCVGKPVPGLDVRIVRITDDPVTSWSESLCLPPGEIGEITVRAPHATREYFNRAEATRLAKIPVGNNPADAFYHRMGDVGYIDAEGRIWFCGRKSHRVSTPQRTWFTIPVEGVFNTHAKVFRSALVGVTTREGLIPALCVELESGAATTQAEKERIRIELLEIGQRFEHTRDVRDIFFHPAFPVDIRHNAKIFREKLAVWATQERASRGGST